MSTHPRNASLWRWFDAGRATEALLGRGEYFMPDNDYREHDLLLVLNQLVDWADAGHAEEAGTAVRSAVENLLATTSFGEATRVLLAYTIVAKDRGRHLIPAAWVRRAADQAEQAHMQLARQLREAVDDLGPVLT